MRRYCIYILLIFILVISAGCTKYVEAEPVSANVETITITETVTITNTEREKQLEDELSNVKQLLEDSVIEASNYKYILDNLNELLSNTYYVYQEKDDGYVWATGFSIQYNDRYYLITAGHVVEYEHGIFKNLGFKANFSDTWIYPELLTYENEWENENDYAVFYSDKISSGIWVAPNTEYKYVLGSMEVGLNIINNYIVGVTGESGSPILNQRGEVSGILINGVTPIDIVLEAIDNIE
jgi:hypothetical protein